MALKSLVGAIGPSLNRLIAGQLFCAASRVFHEQIGRPRNKTRR
jgi:hypothetical protein